MNNQAKTKEAIAKVFTGLQELSALCETDQELNNFIAEQHEQLNLITGSVDEMAYSWSEMLTNFKRL